VDGKKRAIHLTAAQQSGVTRPIIASTHLANDALSQTKTISSKPGKRRVCIAHMTALTQVPM
jgi:hypothetical protein